MSENTPYFSLKKKKKPEGGVVINHSLANGTSSMYLFTPPCANEWEKHAVGKCCKNIKMNKTSHFFVLNVILFILNTKQSPV